MTNDQLFTINGLAAKAIAARAAGGTVEVQPSQLLELTTAARTMRSAMQDAVTDCEACQALGELVTDRCPRCRKLLDILGEDGR